MQTPATELPPPIPPSSPPGIFDDAKLLWGELIDLLHDRLQLVVLETKQAGESLVKMIAAGVMVAVLLGSAWLCLLGAIILGLIELGLMASVAMLLGMLSNLLLAALFYRFIQQQAKNIGWSASLNSLKSMSSKKGTDHGI